ncbi:MAG TPA: methionine--tRNA ligase [Gemmatimonadales bacterium]|nr:methionine--tRNA ligase [Gemmatimonadales bacterium]HSE68714.1 methionine--tRNA ligase [Gemmatimonadales bacterium]
MGHFFITTAIDYANGDPHMGHAFEKVGADCIARYHRLKGDDVWFLIGMDEHGQKVAQAAADQGITPQALVDHVATSFQRNWAELNISYDQFIRTTAPEHKAGVRELIEKIFARNPDDFYEKSYSGLYCVGCESFKTEADIVDGHCALHPTRTLELVEERNWFFRLSRYQKFLEDLLARKPDFVQPEIRRNEILGLLREGLEDVSASRSRFSWGVPFPRPTSDGEIQTTYVWFDALPNYWTAQRFPNSGASWPAQVHVVGKDITRFHTVIWPAMLEAAGEALPEQVWAHGFIYLGGDRFSKSAGVRLELSEAIAHHGPDALRYFLLREVGFSGDGEFSWERFDARYNSDLADGLGNLASRSLAMIEKYRAGVVPEGADTSLDAAGAAALAAYRKAMDATDLKGGAEAAWALVGEANQFIVRQAPWTLAKEGKETELDATLAALARCLFRLAVLASPFLPGKAEELWTHLGLEGQAEKSRIQGLERPKVAGLQVRKPAGLFPKSV